MAKTDEIKYELWLKYWRQVVQNLSVKILDHIKQERENQERRGR